jgi:hypothetical protein
MAVFELSNLQTFWQIDLDKTVAIHNNNFDGVVLIREPGIS